MAIHHFREVSIKRTKRGKCAVCGGTASRTEKFWQTLNPFNKNAQGQVKDEWEIRQELHAQAAAWLEEPVKHAKCEGGAS